MKLIVAALALALFCNGAIPIDTVWQVQTSGSADTNCGGWSDANKGATGVDHSTGAGTQFTSTLSAVGTTTLTDSGAGFLNTMLGNCVNIVGQGTYFITAFTSSTVVTVDRNMGTFSTTSGHEGGPLASLGHLCSGITGNGNVAFFKNDGTFSITSASAGADAGTCNSGSSLLLIGYTSNRTIYNTDSPAIVQTNVSTATVFGSSTNLVAYNFTFDGNTQTASKLIGGAVTLVHVTIKNYNTASTIGGTIYDAVITTNSALISIRNCFYCEAYANTATPISFTGSAFSTGVFVLSYSNTGASTDGIVLGTQSNCLFCTSTLNGRDGIRDNANNLTAWIIANSYVEGNTGTGFNLASTNASKVLLGYGYQGNGTNITSTTLTLKDTAITPASSAFVGSNNYGLNATANAGGLLRSVAKPATFLRGLTSTYLDVNAARHADPTNVTVGVPSVQ